MKYFLNDTWVNDSTIDTVPTGGVVLTDTEWKNRLVAETPPTEAMLATERANMVITKTQGVLALGEIQWNQVVSYRDVTATWAERVIIDSSANWIRLSEDTALIQFVVGLTDLEIDQLFRDASTL